MAEEDVSESSGLIEEPAPEAPAPAPAPVQPTLVPLTALQEEREAARALKQELAAQRDRTERMEKTFQQLLSKVNETPPPAFDQDPLGHFQYQTKKLEAQQEEINKKVATFEQQTTQQQQWQQVASSIQASEEDFRSKQSDYDLAVKHMKQVRREDMRDAGVPQNEIETILSREIIAFAQAQLSQGKNPAEGAYKMAKRYGYQPKASPVGLIEQVSKGQQVGATLPSGGGSSAPNTVTLKDLANLSQDKLSEIIKDDAKWRKLMRDGRLS